MHMLSMMVGALFEVTSYIPGIIRTIVLLLGGCLAWWWNMTSVTLAFSLASKDITLFLVRSCARYYQMCSCVIASGTIVHDDPGYTREHATKWWYWATALTHRGRNPTWFFLLVITPASRLVACDHHKPTACYTMLYLVIATDFLCSLVTLLVTPKDKLCPGWNSSYQLTSFAMSFP